VSGVGARHCKALQYGVAGGNLGVGRHCAAGGANADKVVAAIPVFIRQLQAEVDLIGSGVGGGDVAVDAAVGGRFGNTVSG